MPLRDDIKSLRDQTLADLNVAHDYYTNTKIAWDIVRRYIATGNKLSLKNTTTGTHYDRG